MQIILPNGPTYTPGTKQHITVKVSDPAQRRWGFEFSARLASDPANGQAGDLTSTDGNTQVECSNGRGKPCSASSPVQFITHTLTGTRLGTSGGTTFEFDWAAPSSDVGNVILYAAGNAANGNNSESGDHIYTTSVQLTPAAAPVSAPKPAISSGQVVNGASYQAGIMQNSWVTITGTNLATTTRAWSSSDINGGQLPTSLDNVSVTINNKPAYVEYVSPTQLNVLAPADDSLGTVPVVVTVNGQASDAASVDLLPFSPAFFTFDGKYVAATHADGSAIGKTGLFPSAPNYTTPAKPGETIILYGTGFGLTNPQMSSSKLVDTAAAVITPFTVTIGGVTAKVTFAGLIPSFAQLYQFNVEVPAGVADGDQPVVVQIGGVASPDTALVTVQH